MGEDEASEEKDEGDDYRAKEGSKKRKMVRVFKTWHGMRVRVRVRGIE